MVRLNSVLRLASRISSGNDSIFSRALMMAAARPRPPSTHQFTPQQFTPQQTVTAPMTPQWNSGGTPFQPINANHTPAGYGVYTPEYVQQLPLNSEPPLYGPFVPENTNTPFFDPLSHDPWQRDDLFQPADSLPTEDEIAIDGKTIEQLEAEGYEVETTELPNSDVVTITMTDGDGNSETVVVAEDGTQTTLDPEQDTSREGIEEIVDGVADGQSIEEIAEEQGLVPQQVVAQLQAAGFELESDDTDTTRITESGSGDLLVSHEIGADGTQTSRVIDTEGRVTERTVDSDGKTTTTVTYEQNGVTVEEVTIDDGKTTTIIIDDEGNRTELEPEQDTSREGIDEIAEAVSEGKSINAIAEDLGLEPEQIIAQLAASGFKVESETDELANGGEQYTTRITDADGEEVIASYSSGLGTGSSSVYLDVEGNETRRTGYRDGRSTETLVEANGRKTVTSESADGKTTTRVTHNGYTVTTPPDGDITVRREEDGAKVEVERGTPLEAMVETLMTADLDSTDADEARASEVVLAAVERALAGETFQELYGSDGTDGTVAEQQKALDEAIKEYGPGEQPDRNVTYENPYGNPPLEPPPSGGDWVPMDGKWLDPEVAKATAALNALEAEQLKAFAEFERSQKQLNVFALDPAYEEALQRAGNMFDEALAPQGLVWVRPESEGTLGDARAQLDGAETRQEAAGKAVEEYQKAERLLGEAISAQGEMPDLPSGGVCTSEDSPADLQIMADEYEQERSVYEAAQANVNVLFLEAGLHNAKGGSHLVDYQVSQLEDMLAEVDPDSDSYKEIEKELKEAKTSQEGAGIQVSTAQAYYDFHVARRDNLQLTVEAYEMREQLLEAFNEDKGLLEEGKKFNTVGGKYLGEFTGQQVIEEREDGLWVVTHFEKGTTEERLAPEEMSEWWERNRDPELTESWLELSENRQAAQGQESEAGTALHHALEQGYDFALESLDEQITDLETELEFLFEKHGQATEGTPEEIFSDDVELEKIKFGGQVLWVTADVAAEFEAQERNLDVLKSSDQPVGIMIDGKQQWVHAEIAITHAALEIASDETQRNILETARDEVSNMADRYQLATEQPMRLLGESDADYAARVEYDTVIDKGDEALDILFQSRFQEFHAQGFDTTFHVLSKEGLDTFLEDNLGLTTEQEEYGDVLDAIHDIGGEWPAVRAVPLLHLDREGGRSEIVLLAVRGDDGEIRYVDGTGKHYADLDDFQDHNRLFGEEGRLVVPKDLEMCPDDDGVIPLEVVTARNVSVQEKIVDPLVGIGTGVATVLSFTPAAPVAVPLALLGSGYLGYRAFEHQRNHMQRGGNWNDLESGLNYLSIATTFLPVKAGGFRMVGMARNSSLNMTRGEVFLASIGAVKPNSALAANANTYMRSTDVWNRLARGADWGAITTGLPLMGVSGYQLAVNGDQMNGLQKFDAVLGLSTGFAGTGLGIYGLRTTRPLREPTVTPTPKPDGPPSPDGGGSTPLPRPDMDTSGVTGGTSQRPSADGTQSGRDTPVPGETGEGASPPAKSAHDNPILSEPAARDGTSQTVAASIEGRAEQAALSDTRTEATSPPPPRPTASHSDGRPRGNMGPYVFRADARSPGQIEAAGGFLPPEPTGIWVDNPQGIPLSSYVLGNTRGRFVGTSGSVEGVKAFVSQESRAASDQGHTFVYILNPSRERVHVASAFEAMGRPVSDHMRQVNEMAVDGSIPWSEVMGWRQVDPNGNFVGEFVRNPAYQEGNATTPSGPEPRRYFSEETGGVIADRVYGSYPKSEEAIYVSDGTVGARGDSPTLAGKTHILIRDPETGERILMPWVRGAAEGHKPSQESGQTPKGGELIEAKAQAERAAETQRRLTEASTSASTSQVAPQVRSMSPEAEGLARVYRLENLEALNEASNQGALPPGHYVHLVRTPELNTSTLTLEQGTVPRSGRVDDAGSFRWPQGQAVNADNRNGRIHAVVSELSASQIRERFRSGEGLAFAVYAGKDTWLAPGRGEVEAPATFEASSPPQQPARAAVVSQGGNESGAVRPPWQSEGYVELPSNLGLSADGDAGIVRFQDSLFSPSVRDPRRLAASIEAAKLNGETSMSLISPQARQRIIDNLHGAWQHALFAPDQPMPAMYQAGDYAFLKALAEYVQEHRVVMREPHLGADGQPSADGASTTHRLYHTSEELAAGEFSRSAEIKHFLEHLISGSHIVAQRGGDGRSDFYAALEQSSAANYLTSAKGHSHYTHPRALFRRSGLVSDSGESPALLKALLIDRTSRRSSYSDTFLQLEGWPAEGLTGLGGRHGQDFKTHRATGWNLSTYGASPFSEKRGLTISLETQAPEGFQPAVHVHELSGFSQRNLQYSVADAGASPATGVPRDDRTLAVFATRLGKFARATVAVPAESFGASSEHAINAEQGSQIWWRKKTRRLAQDFRALASEQPALAAKVDPQLWVPPNHKRAPAFIRQMAREHPSIFGSVHVVAEKGVTTTMLGKKGKVSNRFSEGFHFDNPAHVALLGEVITAGQQSGYPIFITANWGPVPVGTDGRPQAGVASYDKQFQAIQQLAREYDSADAPIVLKDLGLDTFVQPDRQQDDATLTDNAGQIRRETLPRHIAKMEELVSAAPNVRFTVGEQAAMWLSRDPALSQALIAFMQRHPDAVIYESSSFAPANPQVYQRTLTTLSPFIADLARADASFAFDFVRGHYETLIDGARARAMESSQPNVGLDSANLLTDRRQVMNQRARESFDQWVASLPAESQRTVPHSETTVPFPITSESLVPTLAGGKKQVDMGTPWGMVDKRTKVKAWLKALGLSTVAVTPAAVLGGHAWLTGSPLLVPGSPVPEILLAAGVTATSWRAKKAVEKTSITRDERVAWENISEDAKVEGSDALLVERFRAVSKDSNIADRDIEQVIWHAYQAHTNIQALRQDASLSPRDRHNAIVAEVRRYELAATAALGVELPSLGTTDTRTEFGRKFARSDAITNWVNMVTAPASLMTGAAPTQAGMGFIARNNGFFQNTLRFISGKIGTNFADRNSEVRIPLRLLAAMPAPLIGSTISFTNFVTGINQIRNGEVLLDYVGAAPHAAGVAAGAGIAYYGYQVAKNEMRSVLRLGRPPSSLKEKQAIDLARWTLVAVPAMFGISLASDQILDFFVEESQADPGDTGLDDGIQSRLDPQDTTPPPVRPEPPGDLPEEEEAAAALVLVVLPQDGLHLRSAPTEEASVVMTLRYGTFLEARGERDMDGSGNDWLAVRGIDMAGDEQQGWVMARYVDEHGTGAMGDDGGRLNPALDGHYTAIIVQPNQTMGGIAVSQGHGIKDVVEFNLEHIIDPSVIYPGDRIYLPDKDRA
ncbi:DUF4781 domain-containing protein [Halomonas sp. A29]|uniref:DUF4781 domain-containing protein n=1 Tax=Halomonas sp. A29 TaxID=3102786 RepID=UPI00398A6795